MRERLDISEAEYAPYRRLGHALIVSSLLDLAIEKSLRQRGTKRGKRESVALRNLEDDSRSFLLSTERGWADAREFAYQLTEKRPPAPGVMREAVETSKGRIPELRKVFCDE